MLKRTIIANSTLLPQHSQMAGRDGLFGGAYFSFYFGWRWKAPGCDAPHRMT